MKKSFFDVNRWSIPNAWLISANIKRSIADVIFKVLKEKCFRFKFR